MKLLSSCTTIFVLLSLAVLASTPAKSLTCEGYVVDAFGGPLHSARVALRSVEHKSVTSMTTKSDGHFKFSGLKEGNYEITITLLGFADFKKQVYLSDPDEDLGSVGLQVGGTTDLPRFPVAGKVLGPSGKPLADALVTVRSPFVASAMYQARTKANGRYEFEIATPGQYLVYVTKAEFTMAVAPIVLPAGFDRPPTEVNFNLKVLIWEQSPPAKR